MGQPTAISPDFNLLQACVVQRDARQYRSHRFASAEAKKKSLVYHETDTETGELLLYGYATSACANFTGADIANQLAANSSR